jgi:enoyl-CoA hydratase/carnithine racemase
MEYETLIFEKEGGVCTITLNRPDRLNAINYQLTEDLVNVLDEIEEDPKARTVILTGAGRAPLSLKMIKSCVNLGMQMDLLGAIDYEAKCALILEKTQDYNEGVMAFVEKRKPVFKGK